LQNFLPMPQGPVVRRPGTRFVAETKESGAARLLPFEFSTTQAYVVEAGAQYFRFYRDRGRIESPPGEPVALATPYAEADLSQIKYAQSADVVYLCHPAHAPRKLSRTSHTSWSLAVLKPSDGPYLDQNTDGSKTLAPSATTGSITINAVGVSFGSGDIDRVVRIKHGSTWGWARITSVNSASQAVAQVGGAFGGTSATSEWRLGAWSDTTGWPRCVTFYEDRLFFAGNTAQPQTIWGSMSGDYENFAPTKADGAVLDDHALTFTISDDRVNAIQWLSAGKTLAVGTVGGEFSMQASSLNEALTPANATVRRETSRGCASIMPVRIGQAVLFVQRARRKLFELAYNLQADGQVAPDLSLLAQHVTRPGLREVAWQGEPWSVLWAVRDDGRLVGLTYMRDQDVVGWHTHPLGGTDAAVRSIATIPGDGQDELWLVVDRKIDGETRRFVEYLSYEFWPESAVDKDEAIYLDSSLGYAGAPVSVLAGLSHLEGETVGILADGATHPPRVVVGGQVTLDRPVSVAQVGLRYDSRLETMDLEAGAADGTSQTRRRRIHRVAVRFWHTLGARIGFDDASLDEVLFRDGATAMDESPPLFTGDKHLAFPKGWERSARILIVQDQPLPCAVTALIPQLTTTD
jgi:hypothetical protein